MIRSDRLNVLLLSRYARRGPSSRIRTYQFLDDLSRRGFEVTVAPLLGNDYLIDRFGGRLPNPLAILRAYARRLAWLLEIRRYDLIWIEIELMPWLPPWLEQLMARIGIPFVVDYDDAWFHRYNQQRWWLVRRLLGDKINRVMRAADLVIAGNQYLADHAWSIGARNVAIVPTAVDTDRFEPPAVARSERPFTVGWIGSPASTGYLDLVRPVLTRLTRDESCRVVLVGATEGWGNDLPAELHRWSEDSEVADVQNFDVGISPLADGSIEQGKCGYKTLQYMACGRPVVVSPVGVHLDLVKSGVTGFFAGTTEDWMDRILLLRRDSKLRENMGIAAREFVVEKYSVHVWAPILAGYLSGVAARKKDLAA